VLERTLHLSDPEVYGFGFSLLLRDDSLIVGAPAGSGPGAVYVVDLTSGLVSAVWPSPAAVPAFFGTSLAWLGDDILIGAVGHGHESGVLYRVDGATGSLLETLTPPGPDVGGGFGLRLATRGGSLFVGAPFSAGGVGVVHVFTPCGDDVVQFGEGCDDGNTEDDDGCSATCGIEEGATTTTSSSPSTSTSTSTTTSSSSSTSTTPANMKPVAVPAGPAAAEVGVPITLDGSASYDPEGASLTYQWTVAARPPGSTATLSYATAVDPVLIPDVPGVFALELVVNDGHHDSTSTSTSVSALSTLPQVTLTIIAPAEAASITGDRVDVRGTVTGPANTGVVVNGVTATVHDGTFVAAAVPVTAGTNVLRAVATILDGRAASVSAEVTATGEPQQFSITGQPESGPAPLTVSLDASIAPRLGLKRLDVDFDGDLETDFTTRDPDEPIQYTYSVPGVYVVGVTLTDYDDVTHEASTTVVVGDPTTTSGLIQTMWAEMNAALSSGDLAGASRYLSSGARTRYPQVWSVLASQLPQIVASYSLLEPLEISRNVAEFAVTRSIDGEAHVFFIAFVRGLDGVWRLDAM